MAVKNPFIYAIYPLIFYFFLCFFSTFIDKPISKYYNQGMIDQGTLFQVIVFLVVVGFFNYMEARRPGFAIQKKSQLGLNLLSLAVVMVVGEQSKVAALKIFDLARLGSLLSHNFLQGLPFWMRAVIAIFLTDFSLFWVHWAMHRQVLWRTHAFHHSISELWWMAGSRTSFIHLFLFAAPQVFIGYYIMGFGALQATMLFSYAIFVNIWIHTNIWVDLGPFEWIFITPNYHRIHHGAKGLTKKNYGFVFTFWDRLFGSYADPRVIGKDFQLFGVPTQKQLLRLIIGW
jgi:sterol desaturase/sphingolipid hydroxylase (fatty acid hydroxylase superfamily)